MLAFFLAEDDARVAPAEVVLVPEREDRQHERIDGESDDVNNHPANMLPLPLDDEDERLQTVDRGNHDDRYQRKLSRVGCNTVDEISKIGARSRKDNGTEEINKHYEAHTETAKSTQVLEEDQFSQIVYGRVDPTTSLGK